MPATERNMPQNDSATETSASVTFTVGPYGVYEKEKQLTSQQIIDMKELFRGERALILGTLASRSVARIALKLVMDSQFPRPEDEDEYLTLEELEAGNLDEPIEGMTLEGLLEVVRLAASIASSWQEGLGYALEQPGDEWPEYMSPPATYAQEIASDEIASERTRLYDQNAASRPEWVAKQVRLYESVTGIRLDVRGTNA